MNQSIIQQLDGNASIISDYEDGDNSPLIDTIPIQLGHRPPSNHSKPRPPPVRRTIRRDNKLVKALTLPKISSYNMRSIWSKYQNFSMDLYDRSCSVSFITEVWEKAENKKHQNKIEELLELKGYQYISTPRPGARRGGGAAIVVDTEQFSVSKLNISIPHSLEIVWGLLRTKECSGKINKLIVCCFYSPPRYKKKTLLIEHMMLTLQDLRTTFPKAGVIISGDRNDLTTERLLSIDTSLRQIVTRPTRGQNTLDVILTDLERFYEEPIIVNPIQVDPNKKGVPSDHMGVVVNPISVTRKPVRRKKLIRTVRPITSSSLMKMGQVLTTEEWQFMIDGNGSPTQLTEIFQNYTNSLVNKFCPQKQIFYRNDDIPFITEEMKVLK